MIDFFKKLFSLKTTPPPFTGALPDDRQPSERVNDVHFSEIVAMANAVNWTTKDPSLFRQFPILNQYQSFMCGANALSKAWGISLSQKYGKYVQLSRGDIYNRRINSPQAGMLLYDMFTIASFGATLEQLTNEVIESDADSAALQIDSLERAVGSGFAINQGIYVSNDIDTIASVIQTTGKGVILLTYFLSSEWSAYNPTIQNRLLGSSDPSALLHYVVAVDYTLYNGVKSLVVEDSAWFGGLNRRIISEDWVENRVIQGAYPMNFKYGTTGTKPQYDGVTITSAQRCLQYDGDFPLNISIAENWGPTSRASGLKFQQKYGLPQTGLLDEQTKNMLHRLFA
jgi:hypothetical protein